MSCTVADVQNPPLLPGKAKLKKTIWRQFQGDDRMNSTVMD